MSGTDYLAVAERLMRTAIAPSTTAKYKAAWQRYRDFCTVSNRDPEHPLPDALLAFGAFCSASGQSGSATAGHISAVRFELSVRGLATPGLERNDGRVALLLRGMAKAQPASHRTNRKPMTPAIIIKMRTMYGQAGLSTDYARTFDAVICTALFGAMRLGELLPSSKKAWEYPRDLNALSLSEHPQYWDLRLPRSKTDQAGKGAHVRIMHWAAHTQGINPYQSLKTWHAARFSNVRPSVIDPLFLNDSGTQLTKKKFIATMRSLLSLIGEDPLAFSGHSMRKGAATLLAAAGQEDSTIQELGRWASNAFRSYVLPDAEKTRQAQQAIAGALLSSDMT